MTEPVVNLWSDADHARAYLERRKRIPRRNEGYEVMVELLPSETGRVLDLGTGDGECLARVRSTHPGAGGVGLDFSAEMLERARARFADAHEVEIAEHDLGQPLPASLAGFDAVVSGYAIHHLPDERKVALYQEIYERLRPGGVFVNVEHVDSPTATLHEAFLAALGQTLADDDPSNKLVAVETQLGWLRDVGFVDVDCFWKWRELAVLAGTKPSG